MTAPLPGGSRRAIIALRTAIDRGLVPAPQPVAVPVVAVTGVEATERTEPKVYQRKTLSLGDKSYRLAKPWPHAVIDEFLPEDIAEAAAGAFPNADDPIWRSHGREFTGGDRANKLEMAKRDAMPEALQRVVDMLNGPALEKVRKLTGFDDLASDPSLYGGGLNLVPPGGFLKAHADFNTHEGRYRTVNVIVYLNRDWQSGDGGELELWADGKVAKKIEPIFNRAVVFTTNQAAVHGYSPVKKERRSIGVYYYRDQPAKGIAAEPHKTLWVDP